MDIRPLNQDDLDVRELESRIELMVAVPNADACWSNSCEQDDPPGGCWSNSCACNAVCTQNVCSNNF